MSVLDHCLEHGDKRFPTEDEEFVLYHVDGVEATGFISHLKLCLLYTSSPICFNEEAISDDDRTKIIDYFCSDKVANDKAIFIDPEDENAKGLFENCLLYTSRCV